MNSSPHAHEQHIVRSWEANAKPWAGAISRCSIASRRLVTDQAVLDVLLSVQPARVLDLGCGEGWLARALNARSVAVLGIDAVQELIECARLKIDPRAPASSEFRLLDYRHCCELLQTGALGSFTAAVCNFSLLGENSVESLIAALPTALSAHGHLVIQTLHPVAACGDLPYADGWREGSWAGFEAEFSDPCPMVFSHLAKLGERTAPLRLRRARGARTHRGGCLVALIGAFHL